MKGCVGEVGRESDTETQRGERENVKEIKTEKAMKGKELQKEEKRNKERGRKREEEARDSEGKNKRKRKRRQKERKS